MTYDANGNMTNDGTNAYTWDRANRLRSMGGHAYAYDGMGSRTTQTVSSIVTNYLLDVQPNIVQVISATASSNTENYLHSPRGIHATQDTAENWRDILQDGLGSVRGEINDTLEVDASGAYRPYGIPTDVNGAYSQPFRFTGEMRDANALQYHRLRFYSSDNAVFLSYDPFEALKWVPGSMNAYSWVNGNVANLIDPSGKVGENPDDYDTCNSSSDNAFEGCFGIIRPTAQGRVADVFMTPRYESTKVTTIMNGSRVKIFGYTSPKRS
ncbi:MAG: RHS repeat-associated core domain-containing protein [Chloroflexi bacterium]|nr:RHS repeat-associated core domain-containing protein [Chloroflexota bacterium]